jgi:hypothetical protein
MYCLLTPTSIQTNNSSLERSLLPSNVLCAANEITAGMKFGDFKADDTNANVEEDALLLMLLLEGEVNEDDDVDNSIIDFQHKSAFSVPRKYSSNKARQRRRILSGNSCNNHRQKQ